MRLAYALCRHFPRWQIVELTLNPLTRLRRLSSRNAAFDQADGTADLSFLPREMQAEAHELFRAGEISEKALSISRAEAANYGILPYAAGDEYSNYHRLEVDGCSPEMVADAVIEIVGRHL